MSEEKGKVVSIERVEVLPPELNLPIGLPPTEAEVNRLVDLRMAQILASGDRFQPYFQSRRIAQELKKLQSVPEQRSWALVYEQWGCTHCKTKKRPHSSCGMCGPCKIKWVYRKKAVERELSGEKERPIPRKCDGCGRQFPAMTDAKWELAYEQHEISKHHTRRFLYGRQSRRSLEGAVARSCSICRKYFRPMSGPKWEYVRRKHEGGQRHQCALKKRKRRPR